MSSLMDSRYVIWAEVSGGSGVTWLWLGDGGEVKLLRDLFLGENTGVLDRLVKDQDLT